MPKNLVNLLVLLCFISAVATAHAQTPTVYITGRGEDSCSEWLNYTSSNPAQGNVDESYMVGFVNGMENMYSLAHHKTVNAGTWEIMGSWLSSYCAAHPSSELYQAAAQYWFHSGQIRITP